MNKWALFLGNNVLGGLHSKRSETDSNNRDALPNPAWRQPLVTPWPWSFGFQPCLSASPPILLLCVCPDGAWLEQRCFETFSWTSCAVMKLFIRYSFPSLIYFSLCGPDHIRNVIANEPSDPCSRRWPRGIFYVRLWLPSRYYLNKLLWHPLTIHQWLLV